MVTSVSFLYMASVWLAWKFFIQQLKLIRCISLLSILSSGGWTWIRLKGEGVIKQKPNDTSHIIKQSLTSAEWRIYDENLSLYEIQQMDIQKGPSHLISVMQNKMCAKCNKLPFYRIFSYYWLPINHLLVKFSFRLLPFHLFKEK